jgi:hypothetical protein
MLTEFVFAAIALIAVAGTVVTVARDGYRRIPTRRFITLP